VHRRCRAFVFQRFFRVPFSRASRPSESSCLGKIVFREEREREREGGRGRERAKGRKTEKKKRNAFKLLRASAAADTQGLSRLARRFTFSVRDHKHVHPCFLSVVVTEFEKCIFFFPRSFFCGGAAVGAFYRSFLFILNSRSGH